ncbi:VWA domain-containing protein [Acidicapsa dinghuensis]|uniref:VWA domain-containing protein n=1 Tax=Acidicapsa dinghuensis TaxID=2218256 RepID=A0ABW1EBE5_9BACT|nr:VWA domain-containing protein [Acidicapsa dinghuensis]
MSRIPAPQRPLSSFLPIAAALVCFAVASAFAHAQSTPATPQQPQQPDTATPADGGPSGDNGPMVMPKKKVDTEDTPPPAPIAPKIKNPDNMPQTSIHVDVPEVTVDVGVLLQKTHQFVPGLKKANFKVFEDGKEQQIISMHPFQAPITVLMICEFASTNYRFVYDMRNAAWVFTQHLMPQDYVALMTFDLHTQIVTDFTQDKNQILQDVNQMRIPGFSETDVFDALYEGLDRLSRIEGQKYIVLIASGRDTFSKITLDKVMDKIKKTPDTTIFTISTGAVAQIMMEARGGGGMGAQIREMDYLQANNQMQTWARMTGGMNFAPRFIGELPDDFNAINQSIRSKYELVYHPTNSKQDGSFRKLQVELVDDEGHPLQLQDEKHKPLKYELIYRNGYRAKPEVE